MDYDFMGNIHDMLSNKWDCGKVDIHEELHDLLEAYQDKFEQLCDQEERKLACLVESMEAFLNVYKENMKCRDKIDSLLKKINDLSAINHRCERPHNAE